MTSSKLVAKADPKMRGIFIFIIDISYVLPGDMFSIFLVVVKYNNVQ